MADALVEDYRWLVSGQADDLLAELAGSSEPLVRRTARLRRVLSAERAHLLLEQLDLRRRAREKFSSPERMFFTPVALEQATDELLAQYKARRFAEGEPVADICCGIGGDLLALARGRSVLGIDRNPIAALLAAANLARAEAGLPGSSVAVSDALSTDLRAARAWHIDPDRRPQGRRTTHVALHSPDADAIDQLRAVCPAAAVKLAPAAELPEHWSAEAELEWISRARECRQLVAWFSSLARLPGRRTATVVAAGTPRTVVERPGAVLPIAARIEQFVFEPDAAVLAAGLTASLAEEHKLAGFASGVGYLTAATAARDPALSSFEVLDVLPLQVKLIAGWLRERSIGRLEIKKRGVALEPEQLRRQLKLSGSGQATLLIAPANGKAVAIIARRLEPPSF